MRILVIDDNEQDLKISKRYLQQAGFSDLYFAESGEAGVEMAVSEHADIVVTDTNLTGIDGFETCQRIKSQAQHKVKVIIVTGHVDAVDAEKAREHGADDYCVKTSDCGYVLEAIKSLVARNDSLKPE